jgi:hypothetical protein
MTKAKRAQHRAARRLAELIEGAVARGSIITLDDLATREHLTRWLTGELSTSEFKEGIPLLTQAVFEALRTDVGLGDRASRALSLSRPLDRWLQRHTSQLLADHLAAEHRH